MDKPIGMKWDTADTHEYGDQSHNHSCTSHHDSPVSEEELHQQIAKDETKALKRLRIGLVGVLLAAAVAVSLAVYFYTSGVEDKEFRASFDGNSAKILETFQATAERRLGAIASFSTSITAYALSSNSTWPFVRMPHFEAQASHVLSLADAVSLSLQVIVEPDARPRWENEFVPQNGLAWIQESADYANVTEASTGRPGGGTASEKEEGDYEGKPTVGPGGISQQIYTRTTTPLGTRGNMIAEDETNLVWWQDAPMVSPGFSSRFINLNVRYDRTFEPQGRLLEVLEKKKAALGSVATNSGYGAREDRPISGFYYPVLMGLNNESQLAGSIVTLLIWNTFFEDILPQNVNGLVAVLSNTCDQAFTYMINGPEVEFLGTGDVHDRNYDHMKEEVSFTSLVNQGVADGTYIGCPLDDDGCQYSLAVYASADMEEQYVSNNPIYYTLGAVFIFVFTSLVFILYDRLIERRQHLVMREAQKSGAIVSSLFPAGYKEKLMAEQEQQIEDKTGPKSSVFETKRVSKSLIDGDDSDEGVGKQQIAELYPECTIFFADIAGFTKWSSTRTPGDVFTLLQHIFGQFDKAAKRRKVFKIETIGDCYLAVTGLPNASPNHALSMAKFANECLNKMHECTHNLVDELGADTSELALRVGLHSGPITAGVLRGEKSRFQVFGDTVNTGSRMESTGERNRIQVSSTTAELLRTKHERGHWLQAREELIEAKGKGQMQTYWLIPGRTQSSADTFISDSTEDTPVPFHVSTGMSPPPQELDSQSSYKRTAIECRPDSPEPSAEGDPSHEFCVNAMNARMQKLRPPASVINQLAESGPVDIQHYIEYSSSGATIYNS